MLSDVWFHIIILSHEFLKFICLFAKKTNRERHKEGRWRETDRERIFYLLIHSWSQICPCGQQIRTKNHHPLPPSVLAGSGIWSARGLSPRLSGMEHECLNWRITELYQNGLLHSNSSPLILCTRYFFFLGRLPLSCLCFLFSLFSGWWTISAT